MSKQFKYLGPGEQPTEREYNRLLDLVAGLLESTDVQYYRDSRGIHTRRIPDADSSGRVQLAYAKLDAVADILAFDCYLLVDATGDLISVLPTVNTTVTAMTAASVRVNDGTPLAVFRDGAGQWRTVITFEKAGAC